jgi:uncharacterized membrane-anchored protein
MNRTLLIRGVIGVIALQIAVLAGEYLNAVYPLWVGKEITLETRPYDPRSMFRGNYARLNYDISSVDMSLAQTQPPLRNGEVIYVSLKYDEKKGLYIFDKASLEKPSEGIFIRGRANFTYRSRTGPFRVRYGIEAYFAPKDKALQLEKDLRHGGIARIMLASNGKAILKSVEPRQLPETPENSDSTP